MTRESQSRVSVTSEILADIEKLSSTHSISRKMSETTSEIKI